MEVTKKQIKRFFDGSDKIFKIPVYQRNYEWTEKQCEKLIEDIKLCRDSNIENYFIGSIVYINIGKVNESEIYLIIDGQQRLTTISLILLSILKLTGDKKLKQRIKEDYLINKWAETDNERIKLKSIKDDYDSFRKILNSQELNLESRISKNYLYIKNKLSNLNEEDLISFYTSLENLLVVDISLEKGKDDPQLIFESINSTGLGLEQSDLVRNFILMRESNQEELYEKYWNVIEKNTNFQVSRFIKDYLTIKNRGVIPSEKKIYEEFRQFTYRNNLKNEINTFLEELVYYSKLYNIISLSNFPENKNISKSLENINDLKITVTYPFLLELFNDLKGGLITFEVVENILKYIETFILRRLVCDISAKSMNNFFSILGKEIKKFDDYKENYYEIFKFLINNKKGNHRIPKDDEFRDKLLLKDIYSLQGKDKNYLLSKIENFDKRNIVNIDETSIEHIMPVTLTPEWKSELGDNYSQIYDKYLNTIGNLTLINRGDNSEIKNSTFSNKLNFFREQTNYSMNSYFKNKDFEKWSEKEIKERAQILIEKALQIWEFKDTNYVPKKKEHLTYFFDEIEDFSEFYNTKIESYVFIEADTRVNSWREFFHNFCFELYKNYEDLFTNLVQTQEIKGNSKTYFSKTPEELSVPLKLNSEIYVEGHFSVYDILRIVKLLLEKFEIEENKLELYLKDK